MANRKLEIGPGNDSLGEDWDILDYSDNPLATYTAKWGYEPLPIEDGAYDLIYASHVLEHIPWYLTVNALKEAKRILAQGGDIEIWVPDFRKIASCYFIEECGDDWRKENPENDYMLWVNGRIFTYGPEPNWHKAAFDFQHLKNCMLEAGFHNIRRNPEPPRGHDHGYINLGVVGR